MTAQKYIKNSSAVIKSALKVTFWKDEIHAQNHWFKNKTASAYTTTIIACNQRQLKL